MSYPRDPSSLLQKIREYLKHGYNRISTDEDADEYINSISNLELLELISDTLDETI